MEFDKSFNINEEFSENFTKNRGVKGKSHVSNRKVICLEIEIDPF
jgi:hypothetical protein